MDIVFNVDDGYVRHMCVTILSLIDKNPKEVIVFHVITCELSKENREYIDSLLIEDHVSVKFYDVDIKILKKFSVGKLTGNPDISYAAYLRLFIPDLLPQNIDKVLYLDCDIVVINSLTDLWNMDISQYCLAALDDYGNAQEFGAIRMGLDVGFKYFNSGVMLINLQKLRDMNFIEKVQDFLVTDGYRILMHDQDILNGLLYKQRLPLEERWNMMRNTDNTTDYSIIHFAGLKPWYVECPHPLKHIYYHYLAMTKWANEKPVHFYSKLQRIKIIIKSILRKKCNP
jgi:lipopolysaccharide biosynthesis glycosyltransferase